MAAITEESESGVLAAAKAPSPDFGSTWAVEGVEETVKLMVTTQLKKFCKEFGRRRGAIKRTKDGLPSMPKAPRIYG